MTDKSIDRNDACAQYEALLAKVEAGEQPPTSGFIEEPMGKNTWGRSQLAFDGDLNAAKSLHEAVLLGWDYVITSDTVDIWKPSISGMLCELGLRQGKSSASPARAWLIAILKALISEAEA